MEDGRNRLSIVTSVNFIFNRSSTTELTAVLLSEVLRLGYSCRRLSFSDADCILNKSYINSESAKIFFFHITCRISLSSLLKFAICRIIRRVFSSPQPSAFLLEYPF